MLQIPWLRQLGLLAFVASAIVPGACTQQPSTAKKAAPKKTVESVATRTNTVDGAEMVFISAGDFLMGNNDMDDNPRRTVKLSGYWIYKTPVTVAQYKAFCKATGRAMPKEPPNYSPVFGSDPLTGNPITFIMSGVNFNPGWSKEDHPIISVSWDDAVAYAKWANADLPTEAQWEKAARGTDGRKYPWGNRFDTSKLWSSKKALFDSGGTHPVGQLGISPYGVTDMAGNVGQWCKDSYDESFWKNPENSKQIDPENSDAKQEQRVVRGGSWDYFNPEWLRSDQRGQGSRTLGFNDIGFRCVVRAEASGAAPR